MQIQSPIKAVTCDVFFEVKNDKGDWDKVVAGIGVDAARAAELIAHPKRPKGSRFVCKINR